MELDLKVGNFVRTRYGIIDKIIISYDGKCNNPNCNCKHVSCEHNYYNEKDIIKASDKLIDLVEYMDLLVTENKAKDINNKEVYFFNPVRCDGFTTFENNQHCMIINMDYIIPIENIKIYQILTKEQFEQMSYKVGEQNEIFKK